MTTWKQIFKDARQRGHFTQAEKNQSADWGSCALAEKLGLNNGAKVLDAAHAHREAASLLNLAHRFTRYVEADNIDGASGTHATILSI